jgi:F-type H+-transporting ATPase subunit b
MEIVKTFGLDPYLLIAQIVNFLIIFYLLKRFLYKPLNNMLEKRQQLAQEAIDTAKTNEKILEKSKDEEKEIIAKARETANEIVKEAKEQATDIIKQAEATTKQQTDKTLKDAKTQIELETAEAQKQLDKYVLKLALDLLKKSLGDVISEKEQSELVEKAMKEMQKRPN